MSTCIDVQPIFAGSCAIIMGSDRLDMIKVRAATGIFIGVYLVSKK